jgi:hypothetical protein
MLYRTGCGLLISRQELYHLGNMTRQKYLMADLASKYR